MTKEVKLLISSAGRRVALLECLRRDAKQLGIGLEIIAVDTHPELSAACWCADVHRPVPPCTDTDFIPAVRELIERDEVSLIIPTIDPELLPFARAAEAFAREGAWVSVASLEAVTIARDKLRTFEVLSAAGIAAPRTVKLSAFLSEQMDWPLPLLVKPVDGSSSVGIRRVESARDFDTLRFVDQDRYIVQELWEGDEYTVNVFFDRSGELRCAVPHRRIEVRAGEVSKGRTERVPALLFAADAISAALPLCRGALCFQAIVTRDGEAGVFELNARFGGGYPLAHAAGATFTRWLLEEAGGLESSASDDWREGVVMLRYDAAVFPS